MLGVEQGWNVLLEGIGEFRERKERVLEVPESLMELSFVDCSDVDGEKVNMDSSCNSSNVEHTVS